MAARKKKSPPLSNKPKAPLKKPTASSPKKSYTALLSDAEWLAVLQYTLFTIIFLRLCYPFWHQPVFFMISDPATHWGCGQKFMSHSAYCYSMPKLYQLWMWFTHITQQIAPARFKMSVMPFYAGVLCGLMPWLWYRALKEIFTKHQALIIACLIGITPSFINIYGYIMNETIVLVMIPLVLWMCFRANRKRTLAAFLTAIAVGGFAMMAKYSLLPMVGIALVYAYHRQPRPILSAILALVVFCSVLSLASLHSYIFSSGKSTAALRSSNAVVLARLTSNSMIIEITRKGTFWGASPSMWVKPLTPLSDYSTYRKGDFVMDTTQKEFNRELVIEMLRAQQTTKKRLLDFMENNLFLFFGPSWPDLGMPMDKLQFHARWMWAPLMLCVLFLVPTRRLPDGLNVIVLAAFVTIIILMTQQTVIMEGRYRKPIEPLVLVSVLGMIFHWRSKVKKNDNLYHFFLRVYLGTGIARLQLVWRTLETAHKKFLKSL